ncbi:hypothetical protein Vafri_14649 [Volvox africanus]|uniref:Uncharacterized protein n=2 Tax=Volvox africanus TaxID=51714 RepID=A0A8J4F4P1_9CHLO|nr:hypothetical protein Vafri_14649 [Volvox africanus]
MATVSSTLGSFTRTCWKRRSNAASFSMCSRYSARVVAPMHLSSPRANMGFRRLAASMAESPAFPAPRTRCNSSIKRTTLPACCWTSARTAFRRSSNSPRNLAPATRAPMSREMRLTPWSVSGTSPCVRTRTGSVGCANVCVCVGGVFCFPAIQFGLRVRTK